MLRVIDTIDRRLSPLPFKPVILGAAASTLLVDLSVAPYISEEIAYVELFNSGNNDVYYNLGGDCDNVNNYNAIIKPNNMLEVRYCGPVYGYSVGGSTISITVLKRATAKSNFS